MQKEGFTMRHSRTLVLIIIFSNFSGFSRLTARPQKRTKNQLLKEPVLNKIFTSQFLPETIGSLADFLIQNPTITGEIIEGHTPLEHAIHWRCWQAVRTILDWYPNAQNRALALEKKDSYGNIPLHNLIFCGAPDHIIQDFIKLNESVLDIVNSQEQTPLDALLSHQDNPELVELFLEKGAVVEEKNIVLCFKLCRKKSLKIILEKSNLEFLLSFPENPSAKPNENYSLDDPAGSPATKRARLESSED